LPRAPRAYWAGAATAPLTGQHKSTKQIAESRAVVTGASNNEAGKIMPVI